MNAVFLIGFAVYAPHTVYCNFPNQTDEKNSAPPALPEVEVTQPPAPPEDALEDQRVINETIKKFGFPQDYKTLGLPGPELLADGDKNSVSNILVPGEPGIYTLKVRTVTEHFSYNGRYEETKLRKMENQEIAVTKGQFGEHFERKSGGYYVRTIGYTLDENGYRQFLIDLSTAKTTTEEVEPPPFIVIGAPPVGAPDQNKVTISSTALGSLIGGNALG